MIKTTLDYLNVRRLYGGNALFYMMLLIWRDKLD